MQLYFTVVILASKKRNKMSSPKKCKALKSQASYCVLPVAGGW